MHVGGSYHLTASASLAAATAVALALGLQGCGADPSPTPSPVPGRKPTPPPWKPWKLAPINITGQHLYDSKTGEQFHLKGIGFPNIPEPFDVNEWIGVLQRIKRLGQQINAVRIYEPPTCAVADVGINVGCFEPFMREADQLGVYVLIAGSGKSWGYFPADEDCCKPPTPQGCYKTGDVLGYGVNIIRNFNFPNTLGIVIVNEMENNMLALPALKAYARDLKAYMTMCNSFNGSATKGYMRHIPLVYAALDLGTPLFDEADYLFCGAFNSSIDIFGLNIERWMDDHAGRTQYDEINSKVKKRMWPGAYIHTEEGGPKDASSGIFHRSWKQIPDFFKNWPSIDGFIAYTYNGAKRFNLFDGPSADASELTDGRVFFKNLNIVGKDPATVKPVVSTRPACQSSIVTYESGVKVKHDLIDFMSVKAYDTGQNGWAMNCPAPWQAGDLKDVVV